MNVTVPEWASLRTVELEDGNGAVESVTVARLTIENIPEGVRMVDLRTGFVVTAAGYGDGCYLIDFGGRDFGCSWAGEEFDVITGGVR